MQGRVKGADAPIRYCIVNEVSASAGSIVISGSSELTTSPVSNISKPGRPMLPWRTALSSEQYAVIDFLSPKTLTGLWLVRTNFSHVFIQGNATNVWTAPSFSKSCTITRSPWNFRYQLAVPLVQFTYRYLRILIPSQAPVDGTTAFLLGGVYAGLLERFPQNFRFDVEFTTVQPQQDVGQQFGGWRQRNVMGEPLAQLSATRMARTTRLTPGYQDDLQRWQEIERRIRDNDMFAIMLGDTDTSQGLVVRPINQGHFKWTRVNDMRTQSTMDLEEVLGP